MPSRSRFHARLRGALALLVLCLACGKKEEVTPDLTPRVGLLELPSSHRTSDAAPGAALHVEITPSALYTDGESLLALDNGTIPAGERAGDELPKLRGKLGGRHALALSVYAAVPYATLARVIFTAQRAGAGELHFKVRKPNAKSDPGWLTIVRNQFVTSAESVRFSPSELVPWDSFAKVWEASIAACQTSARADCGYSPLAKASGGKLDLLLRVRGAGVALRFRQAGAAATATASTSRDAGAAKSEAVVAGEKPSRGGRRKRQRAELLDGIKGPALVAEEAPPEPSHEHVFTLRADQATIVPSPVAAIMAPVCGHVTCPVVLEAEGISMSGQVLAALGAAFPDGTPAPIVAWVLPPRDS